MRRSAAHVESQRVLHDQSRVTPGQMTTHTHTHTHTQRQRETERQTQREDTERETERETERDRERGPSQFCHCGIISTKRSFFSTPPPIHTHTPPQVQVFCAQGNFEIQGDAFVALMVFFVKLTPFLSRLTSSAESCSNNQVCVISNHLLTCMFSTPRQCFAISDSLHTPWQVKKLRGHRYSAPEYERIGSKNQNEIGCGTSISNSPAENEMESSTFQQRNQSGSKIQNDELNALTKLSVQARCCIVLCARFVPGAVVQKTQRLLSQQSEEK